MNDRVLERHMEAVAANGKESRQIARYVHAHEPPHVTSLSVHDRRDRERK
jgi:hypothetical protein